MRVALLGGGRVGSSLATLFPRHGVQALTWQRGDAVPDADVYWLLVKDAAIPEVNALVPPGAVALHASGAQGADILAPRAERGVLHPLMTFPGLAVGVPELSGVGARVEGTVRALAAARTLAEVLGMVPFQIDGDPRRYHAAASLASGHVAAAFLDAVDTLRAAGVPDPASLLLPLSVASLRAVAIGGPSALTGPAARHDEAVMAGHREVLEAGPLATYEALSARILAWLTRSDLQPDPLDDPGRRRGSTP